MSQSCAIAKAFPGLGNPLLLDIDDYWKALDVVEELNDTTH